MEKNGVEKTAVWMPRIIGSPVVIAKKEVRECETGNKVWDTKYKVIVIDERRGRAMTEMLLADEALSLAAFILLTADHDRMPEEFREKIRAWGKEILSEGEPVEREDVPSDVYEGW